MEIELAIYEDCFNLIDNFAKSDNISFKKFCEKWKTAMFQHIYAVQTTVIEVIQTTKAILHLAKRVVCAKDELKKSLLEQNNNRQIARRIGGIYLMYAIYFKQPTDQYVKILVSNETWQNLLTFIECLPVNNMTDEVRYIFWNLYKEDAFRFTALDYDLGLESLIDYDRLYDIYNGNKYVDVARLKLKQKLLKVTETEEVLPNLISLEEEYNNSKKSLSTVKTTKPLPTTKIFHDVQDAIKCIQNMLDEKDSQCNSTSGNNIEIRKELKRKAAGYASHDEKSPVEENSNPQHGDINRRRGIPSVRQILVQELPEFITDNIENSTEDED